MDIKILGTGCANCNKLEQMVIDLLGELNEDANVSHVKDLREILAYNVMRTPALVVNNQVKLSGVVPSKDKLKEIITSALKKRG
ncbi:thioredoxin family protein [Pelotomaculum terephthalicicum JT]|uniref:thioredoxin family protein n=1 Tax=Pelotomaculum TaxID=191373 RepID=UPI0009CEC5C0|nr:MULTISPECIES: thioredoxin family protein [Pelotomaculum]MCG9968744.1 thioredoxin family protein [Pelotomaculum terephthalicicum JT]OPX86625.1 MAG: hypothetical protein A4E54_01978 [Pelotomaculum sp. PtaB.Bin117]OPY60291.1 MAG: hypothetical protein A4E56_02781 [Pelotomaculum sp. PtaU1.Bin065]